MPIFNINRKTGEKQIEKVAGEGFLRWVNETRVGHSLLESVVKRKLFSSLYGRLQDYPLSKRKIKSFVDTFDIDMKEAERENIRAYKSFNDFFTRKLKSEARPLMEKSDTLISPSDGRLLVYEDIDVKKLVQVKGFHYRLDELIGEESLAETFNHGTCIIIRLAPIDYHRFHFPDSGIPQSSKEVKGHYYSVNPIALKRILKVYCQNKRMITQFKSDHFDDLLLIEVGATCVGSIIQTFTPNQSVLKGEEKGYFKFGGSTVILFIKQGVIRVDSDLIQHTQDGFETKVHMGEGIGKSLKAL